MQLKLGVALSHINQHLAFHHGMAIYLATISMPKRYCAYNYIFLGSAAGIIKLQHQCWDPFLPPPSGCQASNMILDVIDLIIYFISLFLESFDKISD